MLRRAAIAAIVALALSLGSRLESGLSFTTYQAGLGVTSPAPYRAPARQIATRRDSAAAQQHMNRRRSAASRKAIHRVIPRPASIPLSAATTVLSYPAPPIQARAAILVDLSTGNVLYAKNPDARLPMASTTKITTAVLALQRSHLSDLARVSNQAATIGESTMGLRKGERLTVLQLLYGLLLNSGNDAAVALAEHVGGTEAHFDRMMNRFATGLHMRNTHYVTPHGLDEPGHYSSARDLSIIAGYALRDPTFRRIVATWNYHIPATRHNQEHWLANVNRVLFWYPGVDGVKPGDTDAAGLCQVVSVHRDGKWLLAVLLNTPTLVTDIRNLLNFGFHDFRWVPAAYWWDTPSSSLAGGSGESAWLYYFGAGHYIRGLFLSYFKSHGGIRSLGYPRTDQIEVRGLLVQYFQGGELIYDPAHHSVYPAALGADLAARFSPRAVTPHHDVARPFTALYRSAGGRGVLGDPITRMTWQGGHQVQFFQYGELGLLGGIPYVVPVGDSELRLRGWLPAFGIGDAAPPAMAPSLVSWIVAPRQATLHDAQVLPPNRTVVRARRRGASGVSVGRFTPLDRKP